MAFRKGAIELVVRGESYGTVASVFYLMPDGTEVHSGFLEPDWVPFARSKRKRRKGASTQQEQIAAFARRIRERDGDIFCGDLHRLEASAERWRDIRSRMGWNR